MVAFVALPWHHRSQRVTCGVGEVADPAMQLWAPPIECMGEWSLPGVLSPIIIVGMNSDVRRDLPRLRQLDHMNGQCVSTVLA
jgi:hypothetical protein